MCGRRAVLIFVLVLRIVLADLHVVVLHVVVTHDDDDDDDDEERV